MKRFVTYLYEYKNGHKTKNVGFLRVDIRNQTVNIQVSIRFQELTNQTGKFYIIVKEKMVYGIEAGDILMKNGQYNGRIGCRYHELGESPFSMKDAIGIGIRFDNSCYVASSWRDEENEVIALGAFTVYRSEPESMNQESIAAGVNDAESAIGDTIPVYEEKMQAASIVEDIQEETEEMESCISDILETHMIENEIGISYRKIDLNEIYTLPSKHWHYGNNSFLIHGFWNYGYLVLKEEMEEGEKKSYLGIPGIFEQPEMVLATFFGFPKFEVLPSQAVEMTIGQSYFVSEKEKKQQPEDDTFGCWFADL